MKTTDVLASSGQLSEWLGNASLRLFDCRFSLGDPAVGLARYREGHLPGAIYAHLDDDLAGPVNGRNGRHPLPDRNIFRNRFESMGVSSDSLVVAYDDAGGAFASRLWWMARWLGIGSVRVLDGGIQAWINDGGKLVRDVPTYPPGRIEPVPPAMPVAELARVVDAPGAGDVVVDARESARFSGRVEPIDPIAGHVPGAVNLPFAGNLDGNGRFLSAAQLAGRFAGLSRNPDHVIHMCGSGVTACHNLLAMEAAGLGTSVLYAGSWSEWVAHPELPVMNETETSTE